MIIIIDGEPRDFDVNASTHGVLEIVLDGLKKQDRYVRTLTVNGKEMALDDIAYMDVANNPEVSIITGTLDELVEDTLYSSRQFTPKLLKTLSECTNEFRLGNTSVAATKFSESIPGLNWTYKVLNDLCALDPGPSVIHDLHQRVQVLMPTLLTSWENQDYVLTADVLEYELMPVLENWLQVTDMFQSQMQAERIKAGIAPQH